jgi:hypothetical protein
MFAGIGLCIVNDLTAINAVLQYQVERTAGEWFPTRDAARGADAGVLSLQPLKQFARCAPRLCLEPPPQRKRSASRPLMRQRG